MQWSFIMNKTFFKRFFPTMLVILILISCIACSDPHVHSWSSEITVMPTCTEKGEIKYSCSGCQEIRTEQIEPAGHKEGIRSVTKAASCTMEGQYESHCPVCNALLESGTIDKTAHTPFPIEIIVNATCTEKGTAKCICKDCQTVLGVTEYDALGHIAREQHVVEKSADCTHEGLELVICARCGDTMEKIVIPTTGHSWGDTVIEKPATCSETGIASRTCTRCSVKSTGTIAKTQHRMGEDYVIIKEASCGANGQAYISCLDCGTRQKINIPATEMHTWVHNGNITAATEWTPAIIHYTCTVCGLTKDEPEGSPLGHIHKVTETNIIPATCNKNGEEHTYCSCWVDSEGNSYQEYNEGYVHYEFPVKVLSIDPNNHESVITKEIPAGYTHGTLIDTTCNVCSAHEIIISPNAVSMEGRWEWTENGGGAIEIVLGNGYDPESQTEIRSSASSGISPIFNGANGKLYVNYAGSLIPLDIEEWRSEYCETSKWQDTFVVYYYSPSNPTPIPQYIYFQSQDTKNNVITALMEQGEGKEPVAITMRKK